MIWLTSDQHFGHHNVIEYCRRPFKSTDEMDAALIANYNSCVQDTDLVYILGDMFFHGTKKTDEINSQLRGRKILIKGNHDSFKESRYMNTMGFQAVYREILIKYDGQRIRMSHYPYHCEGQDARFLNKRPHNNGSEWLLHGHSHNAWKRKGKMINVGVDVWNYKPVSMAQICQLIRMVEAQGVSALSPSPDALQEPKSLSCDGQHPTSECESPSSFPEV